MAVPLPAVWDPVCVTFLKILLQSMIRLSCRPAMVNGLDRITMMNTEYGLDRIMMMNTESPRLAVTPGEWCASDMLATMSTDLRQMNGIPDVIGARKDCSTVWGFPQIDSAVVDCGAVELDDLIFRRTSFPPGEMVTREWLFIVGHSTYPVQNIPRWWIRRCNSL